MKYCLCSMLSISFVCILSMSCKKEGYILKSTDCIVDLTLDSSLMLLNAIFEPTSAEYDKYMDYVVKNTYAKLNKSNSIQGDTIIFDAKEYFKEISLNEKTASAYLYSGYLYQKKDSLSEAVVKYMQAFDIAKNIDNEGIMAISQLCLGNLYYDHNLPANAFVHYKTALNCYDKIPDSQNIKCDLYRKIGDSERQNIDSSLFYYDKAYEVMEETGNFQSYAQLAVGFAEIYKQIGEYDRAKKYLVEALYKTKNPQDSALIYLNLAQISKLSQNKDSLKVFAKKLVKLLPQISDDYLLRDSYGILSDLAYEQNDYHEALNYKNKESLCIQKITQREKALNVSDAERIYDLVSRNNYIDYQYNGLLLISCSVIIIFFFLIVLLLKITYDNYKKNERLNRKLKKQNEDTVYLNALYKNARIAFNSFQEEIDTLLINYAVKEKSKGYTVIRAQLKKINKMSEDDLNKLSIDFLKTKNVSQTIISALKPNDLIFLSLILCDYQFKEIAIILGVNTHALQMRKARLAKKIKDIGFSPKKFNLYLE